MGWDQNNPLIDGKTYVPERDGPRLDRGTYECRLLIDGVYPADRFNVLPGID